MNYYIYPTEKDMVILSICMIITGFIVYLVATVVAYEDIFLTEQWILIPFYIALLGFGTTLIVGFSFIIKNCIGKREITQ